MPKGHLYIAPTNKIVDRINQEHVDQFLQKHKSREYLLFHNNTVTKAKITVGMKVMTTSNHQDQYTNGLLGTVVKLCKHSIRIETEDGRMIYVRERNFDGHQGIICLWYAFAITADKAQGMTIKDDYNVIPGYFAAGQVYSVLSRCTDFKKIHLLGEFKDHELIVDKMALAYSA